MILNDKCITSVLFLSFNENIFKIKLSIHKFQHVHIIYFCKKQTAIPNLKCNYHFLPYLMLVNLHFLV